MFYFLTHLPPKLLERKEAAEAAQARREEAAAKRAEQQRIAEEKRAEQQRIVQEKQAALQAKKSVEKAAPGASISLFGIGGGAKPAATPPPAPAKATKAVAAVAPKGVPTLNRWTQNRDGSISGFITGSPAFEEGESVSTSPIKGEAAAGTVVQTGSGSKYFLAPIEEKRSTTFSLFGGGKPAPAASPGQAAPWCSQCAR